MHPSLISQSSSSTSIFTSFNPNMDDNNQAQTRQVNNATNNDTEQVDSDQQEIKEERVDDIFTSIRHHNPDPSVDNVSTTSNEQSNFDYNNWFESQIYQMNPFNQFESQQQSSFIAQPSTFNQHPWQLDTFYDDEEYWHQDIMEEFKREILEWDFDIELKNTQTNTPHENEQTEQIEDEFDKNKEVGEIMSDQVGDHFIQSHQCNFVNEFEIQHGCDEPEVKENIDGNQMMGNEVEYEAGDGVKGIYYIVALGSLVENNQSAHQIPSQALDNQKIETNAPPDIGQSLSTPRQSSKIANHNHEKRHEIEINKRDNNESEGTEKEIEEDDDDDYDMQQQESTSRQVKRSRLSHSTTSSSTKKTQIITHKLQCFQVNCELMIDKDNFNQHMKLKHSIQPIRCPVKDCKNSFDHKHIAQLHQHTTQWNCDKCPKHYGTYNRLSAHTMNNHNLGQFQCSFPSCTFTRDSRKKVYNHYNQHKNKSKSMKKEVLSKHNIHHHNLGKFQCSIPSCTFTRDSIKIKQTSKCPHPGCQYQTSDESNLKRHIRAHFGFKPYQCKWPQCKFAAKYRSNTIRHISEKHLKRNSSSVPNGAQLSDPKSFLEVVNELM